MRLALSLLLVSAVASANKPAPKNLKVFMEGGKIWATRDGIRIQAIDGRHDDWARVMKVELSDDGTSLFVWASQCGLDGDDAKNELAMADLEAKFENGLGMAAHLKKQYDQAIVHFTKAVAAYELPVYVTNLLSAQSMGKKLDDADATIAKLGPHAPGWLAWRLAVDSDLAALKGRPSTKNYAIAKPGTAHASDAAAYNPVGIAAMATAEIPEGTGGESEHFIDIIDTASNTRMLHLSLGIDCDYPPGDPEMEKMKKQCERTNAPLRAKGRKQADAALAQLGLAPVKAEPYDNVNTRFKVGKLEVTSDRNKGLNKCDDGIYFWVVSATATK